MSDDGAEWTGGGREGCAVNERGWPELRSTQDVECYGRNPTTAAPCVLGDPHKGYHRDADGAEWLDT